MASLLFANNAQTTIAGSIGPTATTVNLASGTGVLFPTPTGGDWFLLTLVDAATGLVNEIVKVTARSGDACTIVRAQEGTTANSWTAGDSANNLWTAGSAAQMLQQGQVISGRLLNIRSLASGVYTPTAGTLKVLFIAGGGGGGGGGCPNMPAGDFGAAGGGGSGAWAVGFYSSGFSGITVSIGGGGAGGTGGFPGGVGSPGGNTTVGALMTLGGGAGGGVPTQVSTGQTSGGGAGGTIGAGSYLYSSKGSPGAGGVAFTQGSPGDAFSGEGGSSFLGAGGDGVPSTGAGGVGVLGGGGSGSSAALSAAGAQTGGAGGAGFCWAWEFN